MAAHLAPYQDTGRRFFYSDPLVDVDARIISGNGHDMAEVHVEWRKDEHGEGGARDRTMEPYKLRSWLLLLDHLELDRAGIDWKRFLEPARAQLAPHLQPLTRLSSGGKIINAAELMGKTLPEPKYVIPGLLPEGATFIAGRPKLGKSWMVMQIGAAVALGGYVFGHHVTPGDVLYLALEDNERRLQSRLKQQLQNDPTAPTPLPRRLHLVTEWPRLDDGGLGNLYMWLQEHPEARLIIVDTLAKVKPRAKRNGGGYDDDYDSVTPLQELASQFGVGVLIVHHLRKMSADDPLDEVSGTAGLTGGVDGAWILRRERGKADASLFVTGRDVQEQELALSFDKVSGTWAVMGDAAAVRRSSEREEVLQLLREHRALRPAEIALHLGIPGNTCRKRLFSMHKAGEVSVDEQGRYTRCS